MRDLLILVADKDQKALLTGLLTKLPQKEKWKREPMIDIITHQNRDNGVRTNGVEFLRLYKRTHRRALMLFDFEGCGVEQTTTAVALEDELRQRLQNAGWAAGHCAVIVIEPEVESWLWVGDTHIQAVIDWNDAASVYDWLRQQTEFLPSEKTSKPARPKEAFRALLEKQRIPSSSSLFAQIAERASYKRCHDPSFLRLLEQLKIWFGG